jgi:hypothetical protein
MLLNLSAISFIVSAGDEDDPEIVDDENDLFGPLIEKPSLFQRLKNIGTLADIDNFDFLDIVSGWFYEKENEPDYLFTAIKLKNLELKEQRAIYAMHWEYDGEQYGTGVHTHSNGDYQQFVTVNSEADITSIDGTFDLENDIVTFKIPKFLIGNPKTGDILTKTDAWTALRLKVGNPATVLISGQGELIKDWAGYGRDYTIQYEGIGTPIMDRISGSSVVKPGYEIDYDFKAIDPDGEDIYFYIIWGDGDVEEWIGPYESGETRSIAHNWTEIGKYTIQAKAKDTSGHESDWVTMDVSVMKSRAVYPLIMRFLQRHPFLFSLIQKLFQR